MAAGAPRASRRSPARIRCQGEGFDPPALQAQILAPLPDADLVAFGRVVHRDADAFWADVEVADAKARRVYARGTVLYASSPSQPGGAAPAGREGDDARAEEQQRSRLRNELQGESSYGDE
jgi:hypothetical protein